ncbi:hypothetical protein K3495_g8724 [Podosphaera aphanis]|nr:hypothetical protein K3495_g8724 [Podosphaera aphanis]
MAERSVPVLKFVGTISLGLLTGFSYTLSAVTLPTILIFPSTSIASKAFKDFKSLALCQLRTLAGISSSSFLAAYLFSPRAHKHPYLLWATLIVSTSLSAEYLPGILGYRNLSLNSNAGRPKHDRTQVHESRPMDASFEVLDTNNHSEEEFEDEEPSEDGVRSEMESFMLAQLIRTTVTGVGFMMSVVGIWGDGFGAMINRA